MKKKMLLAFSPGYSRFCFLFLSFMFFTVGIYAQTVKGTVSDTESKPVSGATVSVKGTSQATATNSAGNFSINAASNDTIVVSYVGFVTLEIPVNGKTDISVRMISGGGSQHNLSVLVDSNVKQQALYALQQGLFNHENRQADTVAGSVAA